MHFKIKGSFPIFPILPSVQDQDVLIFVNSFTSLGHNSVHEATLFSSFTFFCANGDNSLNDGYGVTPHLWSMAQNTIEERSDCYPRLSWCAHQDPWRNNCTIVTRHHSILSGSCPPQVSRTPFSSESISNISWGVKDIPRHSAFFRIRSGSDDLGMTWQPFCTDQRSKTAAEDVPHRKAGALIAGNAKKSWALLESLDPKDAKACTAMPSSRQKVCNSFWISHGWTSTWFTMGLISQVLRSSFKCLML